MVPIDYIHSLRENEWNAIIFRYADVFSGSDVLEIGSGTGFQLAAIAKLARSVKGIDLPDGTYSEYCEPNVQTYDGHVIPFPDQSFDVVFSSHVLEHLTNEKQLHNEMVRVLRPGGVCIHVVPTASGRFWAWVGHYPEVARRFALKIGKTKLNDSANESIAGPQKQHTLWFRLRGVLYPLRHGERGNWFTELFLMRHSAWRKHLEHYGWKVERVDRLGLWYSAHCLIGTKMSMRVRSILARIFGSSSLMLLVRPAGTTPRES